MTPQIALAIFALYSASPSLLASESSQGFKSCADSARDISKKVRQARDEGHPAPHPALEKALKQAGSHCVSVQWDQHQEHEESGVGKQDVAPRKSQANMVVRTPKEQQIANESQTGFCTGDLPVMVLSCGYGFWLVSTCIEEWDF